MNSSTGAQKMENTTFNNSCLPVPNIHLRNYLYGLIVVNSLSSILAAVGNVLFIFTFWKTSFLRTPSYTLILSLAFTDFGVGVVTQPAYCFHLIAWLTKNRSLYRVSANVFFITLNALITGSLLTITAITIDRFLAVHLHLRYQEFVTIKRSYVVVITIWAVSLVWRFMLTIKWIVIIHFCAASILVILDISLMLKVSRITRRHSAQIQAQQQQQQPHENMQRYKKSVNMMYYIMGAFLFCYSPSIFLHIIRLCLDGMGIHIELVKSYFTELLTITILMANSAINPFIYCWRIEEIRNALRQLILRSSDNEIVQNH